MNHAGDCKIYRADYPYCSCGLLHSLRRKPDKASELYSKFDVDDELEYAWQIDLPYPMPEPRPHEPVDIESVLGKGWLS